MWSCANTMRRDDILVSYGIQFSELAWFPRWQVCHVKKKTRSDFHMVHKAVKHVGKCMIQETKRSTFFLVLYWLCFWYLTCHLMYSCTSLCLWISVTIKILSYTVSLYNSLLDFFISSYFCRSIRLIVTYSTALWQCEKGAWEGHVCTPVALGHWGILLWTLLGEQTERSMWHMKWKEFKTQKGLIAEHSFDLTVLTKELLQHYLERQAEGFFWNKRWQQIVFYGCSNIVWMGESGSCFFLMMRQNFEQT